MVIASYPRTAATALATAVFFTGMRSDCRAASFDGERILPDVAVFEVATSDQLQRLRGVDWHFYTDAQLPGALDKLALRREVRSLPVNRDSTAESGMARFGALRLWHEALREYATRPGRLPDAVARFQKTVEVAEDGFDRTSYLRLAALS